jgi:S1-C subfamily serine protease
MPPAQFSCPSCKTILRGASLPPPGAKIRCNKCQNIFTVGAGPRLGPPPSRVATAPAPKRTRPIVQDEDDDRDDRPSRSGRRSQSIEKPASSMGLIIGLAVGGGGLALALAVVLVAWAMSGRSQAMPVAENKDNTPAPQPIITPPKDTPKDLPKDPPKDPPKNPPPSVPPATQGEFKDVLPKVKKATTYIRVTTPQGVASGSGFFEAESGKVLTNAHVLGMLEPGAPAPQKLEVVLNSGVKGEEKTLPGRIITVDRMSDLAVLDLDLKAAGVTRPEGLTVKPASGLYETQTVYVVGFPLGEAVGKDITVNTSSISSLRRDADGLLNQVQVNGGMDPGNSGGPVVDANGNVIGVAVAVIRNTALKFAIPGEVVQSVLNGRCSGIGVGEAVRKGDKIAIPVEVSAIDPMRRVRKICVDCWVGDPTEKFGPSDTAPAAPAAAARQTTTLEYKADAGNGKAEILIAAVPPAGKVLFVQPMIENGAGQARWAAAIPVTVLAPLEAKAATLTLKQAPGNCLLELNSKATFLLKSSDGEKFTALNNMVSRLKEQTVQVDPRGASDIRITVQHLEMGQNMDGKPIPGSFSEMMKDHFKQLDNFSMTMKVDSLANVTAKASDLARVAPDARDTLNGLGDQLLQSLDIAWTKIPGGQMQPGQSWNAPRNVPVDTVFSFSTVPTDMKYTYRGTRAVNGKDMAVIEMEGTVQPAKGKSVELSGNVHGSALLDTAAGRIVQVNAVVDVVKSITFRKTTFTAEGKLEVKMTRTTTQ